MEETVLIVDDDAVQRKMLSNLLQKKLGYNALTANNGKDGLERVQASNVGDINAILLDIEMPVMDGFEALKQLQKYRPDIPVLMLTGRDGTDEAVRAIKEGASDFITKPVEPAHLGVAIQNAIRLSSLSREFAKLKQSKAKSGRFSDMIGHDRGMAEAVVLGRKVSRSDVPVVLSGESGTGKESFARAIHAESKRSGAPFVTVNCGGVAGPVEQWLFGEEQAASRGTLPVTGKIHQAQGGTLFLDDIHELPAHVQTRLLHVLQHEQIEPLHGGKPRKVDVRIISATDRDLEREVQERRFREDLYFRMNIIPVRLPSLRERKGDIPALCDFFLQQISALDGLPLRSLSEEAMAFMVAQQWPGNVRELEGVLHRAMILADADEIEKALIEEGYRASLPHEPQERRTTPPFHISMRMPDGAFKTMDAIEQESLQMALSHHENNVAAAADALGVAKSTFYRKMKDAQKKK